MDVRNHLFRRFGPLVFFVPAIILAGAGCGDTEPSATPEAQVSGPEVTDGEQGRPLLIRLPELVDSAPAHGDTVAQGPRTISVKVNHFLNPGSSINVTLDGQTVPVGSVTISPDQLSMEVSPDNYLGDGLYQVGYEACWPSGACTGGRFAFTVGSSGLLPDEDRAAHDGSGEEGVAAVQLPKKIGAPHFVDSFPFHEAVLPEAPPQVVLNFNFNSHQDSRISLTRDGQEVSLGPAAVSEDQLSMRAHLMDDSGDGVYQINYRARRPAHPLCELGPSPLS